MKATLERFVLKHPKVRAPRGQSTLSHPNTKPFAFYTRPFRRGVDGDDGSSES